MIDITGRQSEETKLRESIIDLRETLTKHWQRNLSERVQGGVSGAGMVRSSFFETLGLTGIAQSVKAKAEAKETDRQAREAFIQNFQENTEAGKILSGDTARDVATDLYYSQKNNAGNTSEEKIEAAEYRENQLEVQTKTSEDITDLYTITDDHFKKTEQYQKESLELLKAISEKDFGSGGLLGAAADALGDMSGRGKQTGKAGRAGKISGAAGKLGAIGKVGGLLAVGTAAYDAYGEYSEAERQVQAGEITKEEGTVKKGEAVGGGVGAAGGALAGAKAGAMLGAFGGPLGMAVGGLIGGAAGYFGGKWLGSKAGGSVASLSNSATATGVEKPVESSDVSPNTFSREYLEQVSKGEISRPLITKEKADEMLSKMKTESTNLTPVSPETAGQITLKRRSLEDAESAAAGNQTSQVNNVSAPTVNNNVTNNQIIKDKKSKNDEDTFQKYINRRFYPSF